MEPEKISQEFDKEINTISEKIENRRSEIEREGKDAEKDILAREVISDTIRELGAKAPNNAQSANTNDSSYLDSADADTSEKINSLIDSIHSKGLAKAISDAREETPYILDAFHDSLVEKLYSELVERKII